MIDRISNESGPTARERHGRTIAGRVALAMLAAVGVLAVTLSGCSRWSGSRTDAKRPATAEAVPFTPYRGLWITRWDFKTEADVRRAIDDAVSIGTTDILLQVRGQADAYYPSPLEPWSHDLIDDAGEPPAFDPLAVAIDQAHRRGVRVHAWMNVMPLWRGKTPPTDPAHPYNARPEWRLRDRAGIDQPLTDHYVIVNPALPAVHAHLRAVVADLTSRYEIDGIHFDYIRFVQDTVEGDALYPGDPQTVARFQRETGTPGVDTPEQRAAYRAWIRDEITALVETMAAQARSNRPGIEVSAAVWRRPDLARDQQLQDAAAWLTSGLIDRAIPMIYTEDREQLSADLAAWRDATRGAPGVVTAGLGTYKVGPAEATRQIALTTGAGGYCLFAYSSIFESANRFQEKTGDEVTVRRDRRMILRQLGVRLATAEP
ncbi:MAG: glycoside hydrolase family 10 protein [Phycisphaerales bacterium JB037]